MLMHTRVERALNEGQKLSLRGRDLEAFVRRAIGFSALDRGAQKVAIRCMQQLVYPITRPPTVQRIMPLNAAG